MRWLNTLMIAMMLCGLALAKEQELITATNDQDTQLEKLSLELNEKGQPVRLVHYRGSGGISRYDSKQLAKGVVLRRQSGKDAVKLNSVRFDPASGGLFRIHYLYSGVPPEEYRSLTLSLKREGATWALYAGKDDRPVRELNLLVNRKSLMGYKKVVGIREIKTLY